MINQVRELITKHGDQLALVVNNSGGKDSTRMLGYLKENFPQQKMYVVMADTGFEHVRPISAIDWARQQSRRFKEDLHVVRNPNKTYLEMVERRGMFPAPKYRQCTSDLKRDPITKFIRHLSENVIVNCTGIRAAESAGRAKQNPWKLDDRLSKAGRIVWNWMPIFTESLQDVLQWHWREGVSLHPVYVPEYHVDGTLGGYLRRFSCRVCIFSTDTDIRRIYENDREAFDIIDGLEQSMKFTMKAGKSLLQIISTPAPEVVHQYGSEETMPCMQ